MGNIDKLILGMAKKAYAAATRTEYHHPTEEVMWQSPIDPDVWYAAHAPGFNPDWETLRTFERD